MRNPHDLPGVDTEAGDEVVAAARAAITELGQAGRSPPEVRSAIVARALDAFVGVQRLASTYPGRSTEVSGVQAELRDLLSRPEFAPAIVGRIDAIEVAPWFARAEALVAGRAEGASSDAEAGALLAQLDSWAFEVSAASDLGVGLPAELLSDQVGELEAYVRAHDAVFGARSPGVTGAGSPVKPPKPILRLLPAAMRLPIAAAAGLLVGLAVAPRAGVAGDVAQQDAALAAHVRALEEAEAKDDRGRALAESGAMLAIRRDRDTLAWFGRAASLAGENDVGVAMLDDAASAPRSARVGPWTFADYGAWSELAQALVRRASHGRDPVAQRADLDRAVQIARAHLHGDDDGVLRGKIKVLTDAAHVAVFDLPVAETALATRWVEEAATANLAYRRFAPGGEDCHYLLHARFWMATEVDADVVVARQVAEEVRAAKFATAARAVAAAQEPAAKTAAAASAANYEADGLEFVAAAEIAAARRGDVDRARLAEVRLLLQDALERRLRGGNHTGIAWCYAKIAAVALLLGDVDAAARAEDAARLAAERSRNPETMASVRLLDVQVALGRRDLGAARARLEAWRVLRGPDDDVERLVLPALEAVLLEDDGARADAKRRLEATASDVRVPAGRRRTAAHLLGRLGDGGGLSWVGTTDRSAG